MSDRERELARSWDENAQAWAAVVRNGGIESRRVATDRAIVDAAVATGARRVLDAGCGEGWLARQLAQQGMEVVGVDGSAELISSADRLGGATFHHLTYDELAAAGGLQGKFDLVICNFSLLHEDVATTLRSLANLLGSGGSILIQTVHPWTARGDGYGDGWRQESFSAFGDGFRPMPWYFRTLASWSSALNDAGLTLSRVQEPAHPATQEPLSLLMHAVPAHARGTRHDDEHG